MSERRGGRRLGVQELALQVLGDGGLAAEHPQPSAADRRPAKSMLARTFIRKLKYEFYFWPAWERFSAKVGPGTVTNGPASKHAA